MVEITVNRGKAVIHQSRKLQKKLSKKSSEPYSGKIYHILRVSRQKGISLSYLLPHRLGGEEHNFWNKMFDKYIVVSQNEKLIWDYIKHHKCKTILEIGLGDGGNLKKMLKLAGPDCEFYSFDILSHPKSREVFQKLKDRKNVHFYIGDTRKILPKVVNKLPKMGEL